MRFSGIAMRCGTRQWQVCYCSASMGVRDGQMRKHAAEMVPDLDNSGELQSLELKTAVHKTARAFHLRHMFLPISAPAQGVTMDNWAMQWIRVRDMLQISDLSRFPLMPAPDRNLEPTRRPVSTQEAKIVAEAFAWGYSLEGGQVDKSFMQMHMPFFLGQEGSID